MILLIEVFYVRYEKLKLLLEFYIVVLLVVFLREILEIFLIRGFLLVIDDIYVIVLNVLNEEYRYSYYIVWNFLL